MIITLPTVSTVFYSDTVLIELLVVRHHVILAVA